MNSPTAIQTFSGIFFDPFNPLAEDIRIEDIAHALSLQCRFSGHVRRRWSVAQHSLMVADLCPPGLRLEGLLHDAAEAYLVDIPRPIKRAPEMDFYREIERGVERAIQSRFGIQSSFSGDEIKRADNLMLWAEAEALLHGTAHWLADGPPPEDREQVAELAAFIRSANPPGDGCVMDAFLAAFAEYGGK